MHFHFDGLIFVAGGIYALLAACGVIQASKNPEGNEAWRNKYDTMLKILSPVVILFGLAEFFGFLK
jgi:hypothetical protein